MHEMRTSNSSKQCQINQDLGYKKWQKYRKKPITQPNIPLGFIFTKEMNLNTAFVVPTFVYFDPG